MITIEQIPPLSTVALEVMRFNTADPASGSDSLERLIKPDKGISSRLLKIANSALYGRSGRIKTLKDSITLLGLKTVKNLVIMLTANNMTKKLKKPIYGKYLQEMPVLMALVGMDLCRPLDRKKLREEVFLTALLAKIGMSIIAINKPDHYFQILETFDKGGNNLIALENKYYQSNYIEVGLLVFETWKLADEHKDAISHFNCQPEQILELSDLARILILTHNIVSRLMHMPLDQSDADRETNILQYYNVASEKIAAFNEEYFEYLQEHPFYEQARQG